MHLIYLIYLSGVSYRFSVLFFWSRFPPKPPAGAAGASEELCVREEDVLRFCFPDKEAIRPVRFVVPPRFFFVILFHHGGCCCSVRPGYICFFLYMILEVVVLVMHFVLFVLRFFV